MDETTRHYLEMEHHFRAKAELTHDPLVRESCTKLAASYRELASYKGTTTRDRPKPSKTEPPSGNGQ